jgi:hypothetical protein
MYSHQVWFGGCKGTSITRFGFTPIPTLNMTSIPDLTSHSLSPSGTQLSTRVCPLSFHLPCFMTYSAHLILYIDSYSALFIIIVSFCYCLSILIVLFLTLVHIFKVFRSPCIAGNRTWLYRLPQSKILMYSLIWCSAVV